MYDQHYLAAVLHQYCRGLDDSIWKSLIEGVQETPTVDVIVAADCSQVFFSRIQ